MFFIAFLLSENSELKIENYLFKLFLVVFTIEAKSLANSSERG